MSTKSILEITDCIDVVDLLNINDGFLICEWTPAVAPWKDGGSWQSSPLSDGKRLANKSYDNAVETFELKISGSSEDAVIAYIQSLVTMLEKGVQYWTTNWQRQPVWIKARGATESNPRYAVIKAYTIDGLANPFSQPFFGNCKSAMDKFTLVIERDHWIDQFPTTAHRIQINNIQSYHNTVQSVITAYCSQHEDDALFTSMWDGTVDVDLNSTIGRVGHEQSTGSDFHSGLRFPSVNIPQGATILAAQLTLGVATEDQAEEENYSLVFDIFGELTPNAEIFNTSYSDNQSRMVNRTAAHLAFTSLPDTWSDPGGFQSIWGLEAVLQEIVDQYGWVSGNALALYVLGYPSVNDVDDSRRFLNYGTWYAPSLQIYYLNSPTSTAGHEDTDTGNVYIVNKHAYAQVNYVYYKDTATGFSANLVGTALPWTLLPAVPAVGDEIYFGISADSPGYGPLHSLAFDLSVAGVGITLQWYCYHSIYDWVFVNSISDKSVSLTETGECLVNLQTGTMSPVAVNGVTGYWCKAVVSAVSGVASPPVQANRNIYTVITPYVDIDSSNIKGEIPALARIRMKSLENIYSTNVLISARSKSRGEDFSPYLNYSDRQTRDGIATIGDLTDDSESPTGRCRYFTSSSLQEEWYSSNVIMVIMNPISSQYQGSFHAYLRVKQTTGDYGDFTIRLIYSVNGMNTFTKCPSSLIPSSSGAHGSCVIDCGIVNFETSALGYGDYLDTIQFFLELKHNVVTESTVEVIDLVLMPCDEWLGAYKSPVKGYNLTSLNLGYLLDIDAIGNPRLPRAVLRLDNEVDTGQLSEQFVAEYIKMTRGGPFLQVNSDQRLWFMTFAGLVDGDGNNYYVSEINAAYGMRIYVANRYLTMRGAI